MANLGLQFLECELLPGPSSDHHILTSWGHARINIHRSIAYLIPARLRQERFVRPPCLGNRCTEDWAHFELKGR